MERTTGGPQLLPTGGEIYGVIAVAAISRAATREHQPTIAKLPEVVRHQALRLVDQPGQLSHRAIALHQLPQHPPTNGMGHEPHEARRLINRTRWRSTEHNPSVPPEPYSIKWI
jgi:hypothetical protein